jgi:hypothetical protein
MNEHEARLSVAELIRDVLADLAIEDGMSPDEVADLTVAMTDMAEIVLEALQFEIVSVDGDTATATVWLRPDDE